MLKIDQHLTNSHSYFLGSLVFKVPFMTELGTAACDKCKHLFMQCSLLAESVEAELLHTYSKIEPYDILILCVRLAVLTAVTLTVPIVLFPVSIHTSSPKHTRFI